MISVKTVAYMVRRACKIPPPPPPPPPRMSSASHPFGGGWAPLAAHAAMAVTACCAVGILPTVLRVSCFFWVCVMVAARIQRSFIKAPMLVQTGDPFLDLPLSIPWYVVCQWVYVVTISPVQGGSRSGSW